MLRWKAVTTEVTRHVASLPGFSGDWSTTRSCWIEVITKIELAVVKEVVEGQLGEPERYCKRKK